MPFDGTKFETIAGQMRAVLRNGEAWTRGYFYSEGHYCLLGALIVVSKDIRGVKVQAYGEADDGIERLKGYALLGRACQMHAKMDPAFQDEDDPDWVGCLDVVDVNDDSRSTYAKTIAPILDKMEEMEIAAQLKKLHKKLQKSRALVDA